ncbi:hypothetical protein Q3G72_024450 [Acer saccharum]|nr:hypothetical protein Q3G72_024450 [Acer saccharum]
MCKLCGKATDSVDHALWNCVKIKPGSNSCPFFNSLVSLKVLDFLDRCLWILSTAKTDWISLFLVAAWYAWGYRNKLRNQLWRPPDSGFKVNVDAAVDKSKGIFSLGVVARDRTGKLLWAGAKCFNGFIDAEIAEMLAILEGVHLAISENLNPVIVESEAVNAINLCLGNSLSRCEVDNIAQDVHDFIRESSINISLCFSPRTCNLVAHSVARWALLFSGLLLSPIGFVS